VTDTDTITATIPDARLRRRARMFLDTFARCGKYRPSMDAANMAAWMLRECRRSPAFAARQREIEEAHRMATVAEAEDALVRMATGVCPTDAAHVRPSAAAAKLLLEGNADRYKPQGDGGAVRVRIEINL